MFATSSEAQVVSGSHHQSGIPLLACLQNGYALAPGSLSLYSVLFPVGRFRIFQPEKEKFWWFHKYIHGGPVHWFMPRFLKSATDEKFAHIMELRKLQPLWKQLSVPVTVIQGGMDNIVDPANFEFAKKELAGKDAEFIFLPDAGHMIRLRQSKLLRDILLNSGLAHKNKQ